MSTAALFVHVAPIKHKMFFLVFSEHGAHIKKNHFLHRPTHLYFFLEGRQNEVVSRRRLKAIIGRKIVSFDLELKLIISRIL